VPRTPPILGRPSSRTFVRRVLTLAVVSGWLSAGTPAAAYVRARTDVTQSPYFWSDPRRILELATPPDGIGISSDDLRKAAGTALRSWSQPAIECTDVLLQLAESAVSDQSAKRDGHNRIVVRTDAWCRDPVLMTNCHDSSQVALTTWFVLNNPGVENDGQILEADIELNAVDYAFAMIPDGTINARDYLDHYDLTSALTHEAGHFIGLAHNCRGSNDPLFLDDLGLVAPECTSSAAQKSVILGATMYPKINPVDVGERTLTVDDAKAPCDIYPRGSLPPDRWIGSLNCAVASPVEAGSGNGAATRYRGETILCALGIAFGIARRRSRRRR